MNLDKIKYRKHTIKSIVHEYKCGIIKLDDLPIEFQELTDQINKCPEKPIEPDQSECCGSGCHPCVMDIYEDELNDYEDRINEIYEIVNQ